MADSSLVIAVELKDPATGIVSGAKQPSLAAIANLFQGLASGAKWGRGIDIIHGGANPAFAFGTVVCNNASVDDTVTVNGVAFTAKASADFAAGQWSQAGTDAVDATSLAGCINASANALIAGLVEASNMVGACAVAADLTAGELLTIAVAGEGAWRFVAGTDYVRTGTATTDGAALAAAINATESLHRHVFAINASGTVHIHQRRGATAAVTLAKTGAKLTLTAVAASARVGLSAVMPGVAGNAFTLASADAGRLAVSGARLASGTGGVGTTVRFTL
jgi:hypothetical protein